MKMIVISIHSLPNRPILMLLATIWFINGLKRGKMLYRVTSFMKTSLKDYFMETSTMMEGTTVGFLPSTEPQDVFLITRNILCAQD